MAAGSHGEHAPVSIKLGRNCRSTTNDCESHRQSEGPRTSANHESPHGVGWRAHKRSPGKTGGTPGLRVPFGGTCDGQKPINVMGRKPITSNPHQFLLDVHFKSLKRGPPAEPGGLL